MDDLSYMKKALALAKRAAGHTSPNPMVGCVLTDKQGNIIGQGYHHKAGEGHAEVMALRDLRKRGLESKLHTAYVTLEPCSHYGRTGPCCEALLEAGVKRVVAALEDPNPQVAGRGLRRLREAGVAITLGVAAEEARLLNEKFLWWITHKRPFVGLKYAMTLDGKLATATGDSKWITGVKARTYAHRLRAEYDAILVGIQTILADDASLTTRLVKGKNPLRLVLDSKARIPLQAKVLQAEADTIIVVGAKAPKKKLQQLEALPRVSVWQLPEVAGKIELAALLDKLGQNNITSLLVEGGSTVHGAFVDAGCFNRVYAFVAPKLLGGATALPAIGGKGKTQMQLAEQLTRLELKRLGEDVLLTAVRKE